MSAADRMVVRTRDGSYRSFPRRTALGMISRGQATAAAAPQTAAPSEVDPLGPHGDEYQAPTPEQAREHLAHAMGVPVEVLTPTDDLVNHWSAADPSADMAAALDVPGVQVETDVAPGEAINLDTGVVTPAGESLPPISDLPEPPRGNASRQEWADYAQEQLGIEVTSAMSRTKIREAVQEQLQSLDRLPQPALTGGRLETPEDEPVTEESVTDDEDPGTE